ncbi:hypothetical protein [Actinomadura madurae]|uniref:hypothetical protein n=1 Tax=Actinomadura madurae TaxID=1993 RepID=UPI0020D245C2|nr:hypothetical protein [Actinomadura madurae]MCP9947326.1 hypothetical protein [Actinomadura madurae]MCP9964092.1 hypothetical protein [Actinomadura madurae]MCP9976563.1 hypothetical protein [Actinomadura madurae]MCQ0011939.1 hypothetical protein [Actinomadura madurae]
MTPEQIEQVDESDAQIVALVGEMAAQVDEAHATTCRAIATLYRLTSNAVFDIELIEATLGDDAEAELATAARALRNAGRIIAERAALLDDEQDGGGRK